MESIISSNLTKTASYCLILVSLSSHKSGLLLFLLCEFSFRSLSSMFFLREVRKSNNSYKVKSVDIRISNSSSEYSSSFNIVPPGGFEPPILGLKVRCLTAWPRRQLQIPTDHTFFSSYNPRKSSHESSCTETPG